MPGNTTSTTDYETTTVDAQERVDELEAEMADVEADGREQRQRIQEAEAAIEDLDPEEDADAIAEHEETIEQAQAEYRQIAEQYEELEHTRDTLVQRFEQWGGSEFTIKKMGWTDEGRVADLVRASMVRDHADDPRTKLEESKARTVQVAVVSTPPDCPDDPNDPQFPPSLGEWLYERVDEFNRFGETSIEDFSLSRRLDDDGAQPD